MTLSLFGMDPFSSVFGTDPFFGDIATPLTFGLGDVGTSGRRGRSRRRGGATAADTDVDIGHWHFDYYLSEPVQLELEEHNDCYLMRLFHAGVDKEKIKLDIENDTLIVSGEYSPEQGQGQGAGAGQEQGQQEMKTDTTAAAGAGAGAGAAPTTTGQGQGQGQGAGAGQGQQGQQAAAHEHGISKTRVASRRPYKRFVRYMALPQDVDQASISAKHAGEFLEVCLKKIQGTTPRVQRIPIK